MRQDRLDLSVCTIVRDEEANVPALARCLPLHRVEWVVVDTGSRDATPRLLREAGVEPHAFAWIDDFAAARNASLERATRSWILWLDADDRLDPAFWAGLQTLLGGPRQAYRFVVRSPRENSRGECFRQIRLIPNGLGIRFEGRIHEQLGSSLGRLGLAAANADLEILHLGYDSPAKRDAKRRRNLALLERERRENPRDPTVAMEYGNCLFQGGDYAGAEAAYLAFLPHPDPAVLLRDHRPPADEVLRHFAALMLETADRLGDPARADAWAQLACAWNPSDLSPAYRLGKRALLAGRLREALDRFRDLLARPVAVGKVATDNATVRRNALAAAFLCEIQLDGAARAPHAKAWLGELLAEGSGDLPLDARAPFEYYRDTGDLEGLEAYARGRLPASAPLALWEDCLEVLLAAGRAGAVLACLESRPALALRSGTLEAFRGKAQEAADPAAAYETYRRALAAFPEDPTVLVYFSGFVNDNRLYARCYADLKAMPNPSPTVREFLRQIEAQGLLAKG